ncbi:MAG: hypothetical protein M3394_07375 [Actinomycetota bacterium]|nr:hypothetical protein [Actinomycetota bacterium]
MRRFRGSEAVRVVGLAIAVALASGGCGGSSDAKDRDATEANGGTTTSSVIESGDTGDSGGGDAGAASSSGASGSGGSSKGADGSKPAAGATPTTTAAGGSGGGGSKASTDPDDPEAGLPPLPMSIELSSSCVAPGGKQTITIRTESKAAAGYDAVYADGLGGIDPGHHGGNSGGYADDKGVYTDTFVVKPSAPAGRVTVRVMAGKEGFRHAEGETSFTVGNALGTCA